MGRRAFLSMLAVVALLATGLGLWVAAPAFSAPKPIGLSLDGVTYADNLPASLYAGAFIVPGDTVLRSFYVQNRAADAGNLAVALQDVSGVDSILISSLSVSAAAGSQNGPTVPFTSATPCRSLVSGVGLAAGGVVRVDVRLQLASSLGGVASQASVGSFDLRVTLTSTDVAAPSGCAAVTPPTGGGGGGGLGHTGHSSTPHQADAAVISGAADGTLPADGLPDLSGSGHGIGAQIIQPNTARFFQEFDIVWWLVAMALGGIVAWWRRRNDEDLEETYR